MSRVLVCCGVGGVGKTTVSAAAALSFARDGARVALITIDPARRLADSLGLSGLADQPQEISLGVDASKRGGSLHALILDVSVTFDRLVRRLAVDPERARRILENRYYLTFSSRLSGAHEYMAMERLFELLEEKRYDLVVVDTPPSVHALDFLTAPERIAGVMDRKVLRVLALPRTRAGARLLQQGGEVAVSVLERLMGGRVIRDIAEFVASFEGMTDVFAKRASEGLSWLRSDRAAFLLVSSPAPRAMEESLSFQKAIVEQGFPFRGLVVNRLFPGSGLTPLSLSPEQSPPPQPRPGAPLMHSEACALLDALARDDLHRLRWLQERLPEGAQVWTIPDLEQDVHDLDAIRILAGHLEHLGAVFPGYEAAIS